MAGACGCLKPAAAERPQVQGSQGGKEYEDEWGALDLWRRDAAKLRGEGERERGRWRHVREEPTKDAAAQSSRFAASAGRTSLSAADSARKPGARYPFGNKAKHPREWYPSSGTCDDVTFAVGWVRLRRMYHDVSSAVCTRCDWLESLFFFFSCPSQLMVVC